MGVDESNSNLRITLGLLGLIGITLSIAIFAVSIGLQIYPLISVPMFLLPLSVYALSKYNKGLKENNKEKCPPNRNQTSKTAKPAVMNNDASKSTLHLDPIALDYLKTFGPYVRRRFKDLPFDQYSVPDKLYKQLDDEIIGKGRPSTSILQK